MQKLVEAVQADATAFAEVDLPRVKGKVRPARRHPLAVALHVELLDDAREHPQGSRVR